MKPPVSIIIVNYNVRDLLLASLRSVVADVPDADIIVVDNNSTDDSLDHVRAEFPQVRIIANNYNAGFPKANNQGIEIAFGDWILLLNPDTEVTENAISRWLHYAQQEQLLLSAPQLLNTDGSIQFSIQRFITVKEIVAELFFLHNALKKAHSYYNQSINAPLRVEAASGAALLIHRSLIERIGDLDEKMFWTEDMEYCYRAHLNGVDTVYLPDFKILHHIGQSGKKNRKVMISNQVLTKINFFRKNHSRLALAIVWTARALHILSRIVMFGIMGLANATARDKFGAYVYTLQRFVRRDY